VKRELEEKQAFYGVGMVWYGLGFSLLSHSLLLSSFRHPLDPTLRLALCIFFSILSS
jgi:hypothetical protein